jgi:hypothetical protein
MAPSLELAPSPSPVSQQAKARLYLLRREKEEIARYLSREMFTILLVFYDAGAPCKAAIQYTEYPSSLSLSIVEVHKNLKFGHL